MKKRPAAPAREQRLERERELERERVRYDKLLEKYHRLVEKMAELRRTGFDPAVDRKPRSLPEVEKVAQVRAEARGLPEAQLAYIATTKKDLMGQGVNEVEAEKEARRLAAEAYGFEVES